MITKGIRGGLVAAATFTCAVLVAPHGAAHPGHSNVPVGISLQAFSPATARVIAGDTVVWTWEGLQGLDTNHSVTADAGQSERFDSDPAGAPSHSTGDTFFHTFRDTGTFSYHCKVHPGMTGRVIVTDPYPPLVFGVAVKPHEVCSGQGCDRPKLRLTSDEPSTLLGRIEKRAGGGWKTVRSLPKAKLLAAQNTIALPTKGLEEGRYRVAGRARDAAGNRSLEFEAGFAVRDG